MLNIFTGSGRTGFACPVNDKASGAAGFIEGDVQNSLQADYSPFSTDIHALIDALLEHGRVQAQIPVTLDGRLYRCVATLRLEAMP